MNHLQKKKKNNRNTTHNAFRRVTRSCNFVGLLRVDTLTRASNCNSIRNASAPTCAMCHACNQQLPLAQLGSAWRGFSAQNFSFSAWYNEISPNSTFSTLPKLYLTLPKAIKVSRMLNFPDLVKIRLGN